MPFVVNQGVRIHYEVEGSGPPVVLMHGFSTDSRMWYEYGYVKELSNDYELILVDARGHGSSDKPHISEAYEIGLMVSDLVSVLDDRRVSKARALTMPCLIFIGEADPRYAVAKECAERIPNSSFVSLPGLDHVLGFARSDLVLPHVKRFLASHTP